MNKQQLASKIWESANKMRSKIEANEYKDYILGFIFYKFLSKKELNYLKEHYYTDENIRQLNEANHDTVDHLQKNIGYFIAYDNLFSTWIEKGTDFKISNVRVALSAFSRNIGKNYKKVFEGIFTTLETGLSKLGDTEASQNKAVRELINLIKDIPMDNKEDYDVLGFIYEYLISNFAANAGKKAGEFYTPHEVSKLMSDIIANYLKDREHIEIYDPTSGSGSLLINIGSSVSRYMNDSNGIKYYAQELKQNTYNLTRMNLIMRGILPSNLFVRNGDTLETDWPYFDETDPEHTYNPLFVDAVVSNPPYSQQWDSDDRETDPRYKEYGIAPKGVADYAFLLHDLYHLKSDGIMTIVLPHGVLFRGGEEGKIRKNLIEHNNIDAIIGLPANIFFGTGIPTIIMVLKKNKSNTDIQIIDASKGFVKEGKNNVLRACDIKKIVDAIINRENVEKFSKIVSLEEIRSNDYNLNIPRYVDSSEEAETYDIYALMFGGIPSNELDKYDLFWNTFINLKENLFNKINDNYYELKIENPYDFINNYESVKNYVNNYNTIIDNYSKGLKEELIYNMYTIDIASEEEKLSEKLFNIIKDVKLVNNYQAYQMLDDIWNKISQDLEIIHKEGFNSCSEVEPNMVVKKKNGLEVEVQEGWKGKIIPFEIVQKHFLKDKIDKLDEENNRLSEIASLYEEILDELSEEDKTSISSLLNDDNTAFRFAEITKKVKELKKDNLLIEDGSIEEKLFKLNDLYLEEKELKVTVKNDFNELQIKTKERIETLNVEEIYLLLEDKWINPIKENIFNIINEVISDFSKKIEKLSKKYEETFEDLEKEIINVERNLSTMIDELTGNEFDMKGLEELKSLLNGDFNE